MKEIKVITIIKWVTPFVLLLTLGIALVRLSNIKEKEYLASFELHQLAAQAVDEGDFKAAYSLYIQSAYGFDDPILKSRSLFEAATIGWAGGVADYGTLVALYKEVLRNSPEFEDAGLNLEYLYWIKENDPQRVPNPPPGREPSREEEMKSGDV